MCLAALYYFAASPVLPFSSRKSLLEAFVKLRHQVYLLAAALFITLSVLRPPFVVNGVYSSPGQTIETVEYHWLWESFSSVAYGRLALEWVLLLAGAVTVFSLVESASRLRSLGFASFLKSMRDRLQTPRVPYRQGAARSFSTPTRWQEPGGIAVACPCGEVYHAKAFQAGFSVACRRCGRVLPISDRGRQVSHGTSFCFHFSIPNWLQFIMVPVVLFALLAVWMHIVDAQNANQSSPGIDASSQSGAPSGEVPTSSPVSLNEPQKIIGRAAAEPVTARPESGSEMLLKHGPTGLGQLTITNGTSHDAAVKLADWDSGEPCRYVFIRAGDQSKLDGIAPGTYSLRFILGGAWNGKSLRFEEVSVAEKFDERFTFKEASTAEGTQYSRYSVTLHPVVNGTATTKRIPEDEVYH
jgi:hypothetical protein